MLNLFYSEQMHVVLYMVFHKQEGQFFIAGQNKHIWCIYFFFLYFELFLYFYSLYLSLSLFPHPYSLSLSPVFFYCFIEVLDHDFTLSQNSHVIVCVVSALSLFPQLCPLSLSLWIIQPVERKHSIMPIFLIALKP